MITTRAPFRMPLGGGGTDLPSFYKKYGGFIFSAAINKYMYVAINRPAADKLIRVKYSKSETIDSVDGIQHDLVREALKHNEVIDNIEISSMADVPEGTGLGSSGAYLVGLLKGVHTLINRDVPVYDLAEEACHIEIDKLRKPVGKHDQYLAAFGGFTVLDIDKNGSVNVSRVKLSRDIIEELENKLVMYFTGISRDSLSILGEQSVAAGDEGSEVVKSLMTIKEIGLEIKNAIENDRLDNFGKLMDEHWLVKKRMSTKISDHRVDMLYELAKQNGVLGGKIMGAGGGGFLLLYCNSDKRKLRKVMEGHGLTEMPFKFESDGVKVITHF